MSYKLPVLLFECLNYYPEQRPTSNEILKFLDPQCKDTYIRNNPEKTISNTQSNNLSTIPLVSQSKILESIDNQDAKQFWKKYIGENVLFIFYIRL